MAVIPQTVEFVHKVTWTIKNFGFRPKFEESQLALKSPEFQVRCLDVVTWSFDLYPNGLTEHNMQFAVRLHYSGKRDVSELHVRGVKLNFGITGDSGLQCFETEGFFTPSFAEPTSCVMNFAPIAKFSDEKHLRGGALVLVCELTTKVDQVEFLASVYNDAMVTLSNRLGQMIEFATCSDMMAYSKDKVKFDVHTCILKARCPIIFNELLDQVDYTQPRPAWFTNMSTSALNVLISYIYGRMTIVIPDSLKAEMMSIAIQLGLNDLEKKLREYPIDLSLESDIIVEDISLKYSLHDFKWEKSDGTKPRMHFLPTRNLQVSDLVVSFEVILAADVQEEQDYLKIGLQFSNFETKVPIFMKCEFCLLDDSGRELDREEHCHTFDSDEEWIPPPFLTRNSYQRHSPRTLQCKALLTETSMEGQVLSNVCKVEPGRCVLFNNLLLVGDELRKMYVNGMNSDLKIKVLQSEFLGHKSFLVNCSPTIKMKVEFAEKAMDDDSGMVEIRLENVTPHICQKVLLYLYSGRINIEDEKTAEMLRNVARYLRLPQLLAKTSNSISG